MVHKKCNSYEVTPSITWTHLYIYIYMWKFQTKWKVKKKKKKFKENTKFSLVGHKKQLNYLFYLKKKKKKPCPLLVL